MSKWKTGWKVVRGQNRDSVVMHDTSGSRCYKKGVTVGRAKGCGPLCVYRTRALARQDALDHFIRQYVLKVVKCLYVPSKHKKVWNKETAWYLYALPPGTVLAEKVICLQ